MLEMAAKIEFSDNISKISTSLILRDVWIIPRHMAKGKTYYRKPDDFPRFSGQFNDSCLKIFSESFYPICEHSAFGIPVYST